MKIVDVLKQRNYFAIAAVSSALFAMLYIYTQVLGIIANIDIWFSVIPWYNAVLFVVFAALFGVTLSFQIYNWRQPKICSTAQKTKGAGIGGSASFIGLLVAQCPACASLSALFLPVSMVGFFTQFSFVINVISIGMMLFAINYLGGFRR